MGPIDLVATRYGVRMQNATNIALTKLDILSYMDRIPRLCPLMRSTVNRPTSSPSRCCWIRPSPSPSTFPAGTATSPASAPGEELPQAARDAGSYVEQAIGCRIGYVSVGAERDSLIVR